MSLIVKGLMLSEFLVLDCKCPICSTEIPNPAPVLKQENDEVLMSNIIGLSCSKCACLLIIFSAGAMIAPISFLSEGERVIVRPRDERPKDLDAEFCYAIKQTQEQSAPCFDCGSKDGNSSRLGFKFYVRTRSAAERILKSTSYRAVMSEADTLVQLKLSACTSHTERLSLLLQRSSNNGYIHHSDLVKSQSDHRTHFARTST